MGKIIMLGIIFLVLLSIFAIASNEKVKETAVGVLKQGFVSLSNIIVDKKNNIEKEDYTEKDKLTHKELVIRKQIGTGKHKVEQIVQEREDCNWHLWKCPFGYHNVNVLKEVEINGPIYEDKIVGYEVNGIVVDKYGEKVSCFLNPDDVDIEICYANEDGFNENINDKWKKECKSGTSCFARRISTGEVIESQTDIGVLK